MALSGFDAGQSRNTDTAWPDGATVRSETDPFRKAAIIKRGFVMPELLTAATYLVVWLICWRVIGIESGLTKLILSLGAAIFVFVLLSVREHQRKKRGGK
jgi:hypothetical protein